MQSLPNNYPPPSLSRRSGRRLALFLFVAAWAAGLGIAAANRNGIHDWLKLRNYDAPAVVVQLAQADGMTDYGRNLFYINHPVLEGKTKFPSVCPNNGGEQTIVLGCYRDSQRGIFLLDVTDVRLDGVEQVTAAHEMLHAGYERLSSAERNRVNGMLQDYYRNQLQDDRIRRVIAAYTKSEPHDVVNEMHSIFGTEVADLPAPLESYYTRYFNNRQQVAAFAAKYQNEFASRQAQITGYDKQLRVLKARIDASESDLKAQQAAINSRQGTLLTLRSSNPAAYNAAVPEFNALVDAYNTNIEEIRSLIAQHNQLVAQRNAVALEEGQLVEDLSTSAVPAQQ